MASTFTTNLRLEQMGIGDNDSTWGTILNTQIGLLDASITGFLDVPLSTGTISLTAANGTSDQSRNNTLRFTGTLLENVTVVIPDSASKQYSLINDTSGAYTVTFKTSSGTGLEIAQGTKMIVVSDGASVQQITNPIDSSGLPLLTNISASTGTFTSSLVANNIRASSGIATSSSVSVGGTLVVTGDANFGSGVGIVGNLTLSGGSSIVASPTVNANVVNVAATVSTSVLKASSIVTTNLVATSGSVAGSTITGAVAQVAPNAQFSHTVPSGVNSGTATAGSWQTRLLNTIDWNNISGSTFGGASDITLPAGSYYIEAVSSLFRVNGAKIALYNTTDSVFAINGNQGYFPQSNYVGGVLTASGRVTIASSKTFELRYFVGLTQSGDGQGTPIGSGQNEVYATVRIWKYV